MRLTRELTQTGTMPSLALDAAPPRRRAAAGSSYGRRAFLADALMLALAIAAVDLVSPTGSPTGQIPAAPLAWSLAFAVLVIVLYRARGLYAPPLRLDLLETVRMLVTGAAVAAMAAMAARVLIADDAYVAAETVRQLLFAVPLLMAGRTVVLWHESRARRAGSAGHRTLIVGAGRIGRLAAERLLKDPDLGLRPVAFLDDAPLPAEPRARSARLPILGTDEPLPRLLSEHGVDQVLITFSTASHEEMLALARECLAAGVRVSVVPRLFELEGERVATDHLGGLPLVAMRPADTKGWRLSVKYGVDRVLALTALVVLLPVLILGSVAVLLSMGRPIFYRQRRLGRDGHEFEMLKLRTLREAPAGAPAEADADWLAAELGMGEPAAESDHASRITRVGSFLRRYSLDELPQLWNVVRGDMSLVGPRPERATYARQFEGAVYRYEDRHRVKSGLTGWAQVNGLRGKTPLADRIEWDNHYIENWSLWFDFKILVRTVACVVGQRGE